MGNGKKMKKFSIKKTLTGILFAGVFATSLFIPQATIPAFADETTSNSESFEMSMENINELWVGDTVDINRFSYANGEYNKTEVKIVEGDSIEATSIGFGYVNITSIKPGYSKLQIDDYYYVYKDGGLEYNDNGTIANESELVSTRVYEINVSSKPEDTKFIGIPESIKLGQSVRFTVENANYGTDPGIYISDPNNNFRLPGVGGGGLMSRKGSGYLYTAVMYDYDGTLAENATNLALEAFYPGTYTYTMYDDIRYDNDGLDDSLVPIGTGTLTVEAPVINTNAPEIVEPGSTLEFKTSLDNIYMEDESIAKLFKAIYEPEITILEGTDCIEQSNKVYDDLSSSETLKFIKNGTVTIQIKYIADVDYEAFSSEPEVYYPLEGNYSPVLYTASKTITVTVSDENTDNSTDTEDSNVSDNSSNSVNPEQEMFETEAKIEGVESDVILKAEILTESSSEFKTISANPKTKDQKFVVTDLKLVKDDVSVQPNGKIKITLPVISTIKNAKYIEVFRLNNASKQLDSLGVVPVTNKKFTFETDHFSIYVFMEVATMDKNNGADFNENDKIEPTIPEDTKDDVPDTGDSSIIVLCIIVLTIETVILSSRKFIQR